ncbi:MAG: accessory factor UbiK family protein [Rhodospirillales bacterium]|nr:accessory factor UbiK family protein [Alphaproteobacteria bacterium]MCB9981346.1 accessory factor UbiK family protein [Rhodospirillales bacterium]
MIKSKDKMLDDIAHVAGGTLSIFSGLGENIREDVKTRIDEIAHRLDLVPREDFERLEALVQTQEKRIQTLEKSLKIKK